MEKDKPSAEIRRSLSPLAWLYGLGVNFRNALFDKKILKQTSFDIPVICVGNLTVGGTGKTPHIEYLIRLLSPIYKVAVLSRGYKRKSNGFKIVDTDSKAHDVGDEPLQIKQKFPEALVVVDKDRVSGISKILSIEKEERPDVILLDDGFQHRYVRPSLSILLVDSNRPVFEDRLLPAGSLREPLKGKERASIIIVTKCDPDMQPIDFRIYTNGLALYAFQQLYFTGLDYGMIMPLFPELQGGPLQALDIRKKHIFLVAGIASPQPLVDKVELITYNLYTKFFPDHHSFKEKDIQSIRELIHTVEVDDNNKVILTTEKDAVRLRELPYLDEEMKKMLYYIPVQVTFINEKEQEQFNNNILEHVRNYQTNSGLSKK
ncbi:Tetraacyldisaccharide 4'-kinase [Proteiniphilum saccharofermentans]|uniref:Tetraacyldisaccharide 4'-kinase n=1 Tax=Proteiniphilum saccharofermentans TaxID=1642647 RepID=A0A1R3TDB7_9BACT|nr:tetraacyldisaccharide 4'-kinase [Proteiniphilum saccharofermentans]SCD21614.1 Tetraacyldisaccharide 4'-kinase [Proteiniphilum saccharofermentans]SFS52528.1 lipid-A-disaccharide kinase [Porphyromonadaceae bacterium NLAE-zl-C104]